MFKFLLCLLLPALASAQIFTRVTEGDLVNDGGASRASCLIDYDNDGDLDAFIANSEGQDEFLYQNDGSGNFTRIIGDPITDAEGDSDGATFGDMDNDGDLDCFFTNWANQFNALFENNGDGSFTQLNLAPITTVRGYCETGSWGDYDNDGDVDLFVTHSAGAGHHNKLFRNDGNLMFTSIAGDDIVSDTYNSRSADWCDYDNDGDIDLFTANESAQNDALYNNNGDGSFTAVTEGEIVNDNFTSITSSWGDYDNDGDFDLFVGGYQGGTNRLYNNNGDGTFTRITAGAIPEAIARTFGSAWGDYDNDGDLDLFCGNAIGGRQQNYVFENLGNGEFTQVTNDVVATDSGWTYGCTWGDVERDGDLDLLIACWYQETENNRLYVNNGNANHWLTVKCVGETSNRAGIGARIRARAMINGNAVWQLRQVAGQNGYCGQTLEQHFGFGNTTIIDSLIIDWPSGVTDTYTNVAPDQVITATEGQGIVDMDEHPGVPQIHKLLSAYPNPFNPDLNIVVNLSRRSDYSVDLFDTLGRQIARIAGGTRDRGEFTLHWTPVNLAAGNYLIRIHAGNAEETVRVTYLK